MPPTMTAKFNLGLLIRINLKLGADSALSAFALRTIYSRDYLGIKMQLLSLHDKTVLLFGENTGFRSAMANPH